LRNPIKIVSSLVGLAAYEVETLGKEMLFMVSSIDNLRWTPHYTLFLKFSGPTNNDQPITDTLQLSLTGKITGDLSPASATIETNMVRVHTQPLLQSVSGRGYGSPVAYSLRATAVQENETEMREADDEIIQVIPVRSEQPILIADGTVLPVVRYSELKLKRLLFLTINTGNYYNSHETIYTKPMYGYLGSTRAQIMELPMQIYEDGIESGYQGPLLIGSSYLRTDGDEMIFEIGTEALVIAKTIISSQERKIKTEEERKIKTGEERKIKTGEKDSPTESDEEPKRIVEETQQLLEIRVELISSLLYSLPLELQIPLPGRTTKLIQSDPPHQNVRNGALVWSYNSIPPGNSSISLRLLLGE
jgi:hypothetical protein